MAVVDPGTLLALLTAVFRSTTSAAFCKLSCELLPLPTLIVGTLSDAPFGVILAAQVTHYYASPVLHILAMVTNSELLDQWENVEIIWK